MVKKSTFLWTSSSRENGRSFYLPPSKCEEEYGLAKVTLHKLRSVPVNNSGRIRLITVHQPVGRSEGSAICDQNGLWWQLDETCFGLFLEEPYSTVPCIVLLLFNKTKRGIVEYDPTIVYRWRKEAIFQRERTSGKFAYWLLQTGIPQWSFRSFYYQNVAMETLLCQTWYNWGGILVLYVYCFKNEMKNKFLMRLIMDKKRVFGYLGLKFVVNFN